MSITKYAFTKYHGNGNDFIIVDLANILLRPSMAWFIKQAQRLSKRHVGIGADGLIILTQAKSSYVMSVINADGSIAKNCGNGLRCAAAYIFDKTGLDAVTIELHEQAYVCHKVGGNISVLMGTCHIMIQNDYYFAKNNIHAKVAIGEIGNLHLLILVNEPIACEEAVHELTSSIATPEMNIGFLSRDIQGRYCSQVFERGVGFTNSCGSGASAAAAFLSFLNPKITKEFINIVQPGGNLDISVTENRLTKDAGWFTITQRGRAEQVFTGIFEAEDNC